MSIIENVKHKFLSDSQDKKLYRSSESLYDLWTPKNTETNNCSNYNLMQLLREEKVVSLQQLNEAENLASKGQGNKRIEDILYEMGVKEDTIQRKVSILTGIAFEEINGAKLDNDDIIEKLGCDYCLQYNVLPLRYIGRRLLLGIVYYDDLHILDDVRHKLAILVKPVLICRKDIIKAIEQYKESKEVDDGVGVDEIIGDIEDNDVEIVETEEEDLDLEKIAGESPVIRFVNYLIYNAVKEGASDIHIEPQEKKLQIRYRIDGVLFETTSPPYHMHAAIISRLKIMANLDISERRLPQDGRIRAMVHGRKLDLRLSTLPLAAGEKAVLRILDTKSIQVTLNQLGMSDNALTMWRSQISQPHGIILVTGPTGSGKTTTLYSSLGQMNRAKLNISTVEDPVEYHLNGINQTQVHDKIGMTFPAALRSLLRQDPDVIMVGEIRDAETAKTAIQASLTGHLVLSTLHTNDAPSSVTRLINIGVEPYLIGSAVNATLAQRLVRRVCEHCKEKEFPSEHIANHLKKNAIDVEKVWVGKGCEQCRGTGYSGRLGLYEMLILDDNLRDRIAANPNVTEFRRMCIEGGMVTLRKDGYVKVLEGKTTVEEVLRVTEG